MRLHFTYISKYIFVSYTLPTPAQHHQLLATDQARKYSYHGCDYYRVISSNEKTMKTSSWHLNSKYKYRGDLRASAQIDDV